MISEVRFIYGLKLHWAPSPYYYCPNYLFSSFLCRNASCLCWKSLVYPLNIFDYSFIYGWKFGNISLLWYACLLTFEALPKCPSSLIVLKKFRSTRSVASLYNRSVTANDPGGWPEKYDSFYLSSTIFLDFWFTLGWKVLSF